MKIIFIFLATLLASTSFAQEAKTYCACQTGEWPESQVGFFKAGCRMWLGAQKNCSDSLIVPGAEGVHALPTKWDGAVVKLGYVGHWDSYLNERFLDVIYRDGVVARNMSFEVDNTACNGMSYPKDVTKQLGGYSYSDGKYIKFKANQVLSVGMWDPLLIGKSNLWAEYDSRTNWVKYPRCAEFEKQACTDLGFQVQEGSRGNCRTSQGDLRPIRCCNMTIEATRLSAKKDSEPQKVKVSGLMWASQEACEQGHF